MDELRGLWRGKRLENDEWALGCLIRSSSKSMIFVLDDKTNRISGTDVDPSTLGECTGLRDKNGKLIFEEDICTVATSNIADDEYGIVMYDENEAVFIINFGTYTINYCNNVNSSAVEVIGNIHDNPTLAEQDFTEPSPSYRTVVTELCYDKSVKKSSKERSFKEEFTMACDLFINKSGKSLTIFEGWPYPDRGAQSGTIYNNEAFCGDGTEDGEEIYFRNKSGSVAQGFYYGVDANGKDIFSSNADERKAFSLCTDYPYGTIDIDGETYYTFKFRRAEEVYTARGNRWGTVASGMRVACKSALMGESHPDWKAINYVERSSDGAWVKVTGDGYQYGFVDIGLNQGSTPSTISMYGTW